MRRVWVTSNAYDAAIQSLIAARHRQNLSQRDMAERLGKPRSFVSKLENKERRLDIVEFVALAQALEIAPESLLTELISHLPQPLDF